MLGKGTATVCTDPGCEPETTWDKEGVSSVWSDGREWYGFGVIRGGICVYCVCSRCMCVG